MAEAFALADRVGVLDARGRDRACDAVAASADPRARTIRDGGAGRSSAKPGRMTVSWILLARIAPSSWRSSAARRAGGRLDGARGRAIGVPLGIFAARRPRSARRSSARQPRADDPEPGAVRLPAAAAVHRRHRPAHGARGADALRGAADRADDGRRAAGHRPRGGRRRGGDGDDAAAAAAWWSCRWRCRRSSPASASRPWSASARRRSRRRSAPAGSATTSSAACRWSIRR